MFETTRVQTQRLGQILRRAAGRSRTLERGYRWLVARYREISPEVARLWARLEGRGARDTGIRAENIIWIFGSGRSGSTWLRSMMEDLDQHQLWEEPMVGRLFGSFHHRAPEVDLSRHDFILANATRKGWTRAIRNFVLDCANYTHPRLGTDAYLIIKEPNGSIGAPLLMEALPESRMIFLIRDPRDVIASRMDAFAKGSWTGRERDYSTAESLNKYTKRLARDYKRAISKVQQAYKAHPGQKTIVRYEDLRHDTLNTLKTMYDALEVEADRAQLEGAVMKHSWARVPDSEKGKDKFFRKAQPGSWRDDLSSEQIKLIEDITGPILSNYY